MNKFLPIKIYSIFSILLALTFQSCEIINPPEQIPFYLRIDSISFMDSSTTPATITKKGVQNIVDAWVSVDGEYIGTYELPTTIPVLKPAGNHRVSIIPGILFNGVNSDRSPNPFFSTYTQNISTTEGSIDTIDVKVSYKPNQPKYPSEGVGQFPEGFEGAGTIIKTAGSSKIDTIRRTSDKDLVFDGNFSLIFEMNATDNYVEFETSKSYSLPSGLGIPIYVELNFRTDVQFLVGVYAENVVSGQVIDIPYLNLLPTDNEWKKIYINLTNELSTFKTHKFKIYFKAFHDPALTNSKLLIDNFKLIYL